MIEEMTDKYNLALRLLFEYQTTSNCNKEEFLQLEQYCNQSYLQRSRDLCKTKFWKSERLKFLGKECETCGSTLKLTLQHTVQPDSLKTVYRSFLRRTTLQSRHLFYDNVEKFKNRCTKCNKAVRFRKKDQLWICTNKTCNHISEIRNYEIYYVLEYNEEKHKGYKEKNFNDFINNAPIETKLQVMCSFLMQKITYLSFTHVKTLCNKCAFKEDLVYIRPGY